MIKIPNIRNIIRDRRKVVIARKTATLKESIEFEKDKAGLRKLEEQKYNISQKHKSKKGKERLKKLQKISKIISNVGQAGAQKKKKKGGYDPFNNEGNDKKFWMG